MGFFRTIFLLTLNGSIASGLVALALFALRPATRRILPARYQPWLWVPVCYPIFYTSFRNIGFSWNFLGLIPGRTGYSSISVTEYFPRELTNGGTLRDIVLPGNIAWYRGSGADWYAFTDRLFSGMTMIWLAGLAVMVFYWFYQTIRLNAITRQAICMDYDHLIKLLKGEYHWFDPDHYHFYLCAGLPTSFVRSGWIGESIYLQAELPENRRELVLRHEYNHVAMRHTYFKAIFLIVCTLCWYNPLMWLACHFYCRDMEYACDEKTLSQLSPEQQTEYAQTLLDCASAKPMPGSPTSFAETDAQNRIKTALRFRPAKKRRLAAGWLLTAVLIVFFMLGPAAQSGAAAAEAMQVYPRFIQQQNEFSNLADYVPESFAQNAVSAAYSEPAEDNCRFSLKVVRQDGAVCQVDYLFYNSLWQRVTFDHRSFEDSDVVWHKIVL